MFLCKTYKIIRNTSIIYIKYMYIKRLKVISTVSYITLNLFGKNTLKQKILRKLVYFVFLL